jgi:SAM-dependent methyltransferase
VSDDARGIDALGTDVLRIDAEGLLPPGLAATRRPVDPTIGAGEQMPADDLAGYLATGESALKAVRLALLAARRPEPRAILDLPCGHGRVLRWLAAAFPDASLSACDLLTDGVDFCAARFGATPIHSVRRPGPELFDGPYDLIWVGSLLTHLDVDAWDHFLDLFHRLLAPGGLLVATTHGELVATRMRAGHLYGYPELGVARALRTYDHAGFTFLEEGPTSIEYGITISSPAWVVDRFTRGRDWRVVMYTDALWANHQDVVAVAAGPLAPEVAHRART